jgi:hypothetical protein
MESLEQANYELINSWLGKTIGENDRYLLEELLTFDSYLATFKAKDLKLSELDIPLYRTIEVILFNDPNQHSNQRLYHYIQEAPSNPAQGMFKLLDYGILKDGRRNEFKFIVSEFVEGKYLSELGSDGINDPLDIFEQIVSQIL